MIYSQPVDNCEEGKGPLHIDAAFQLKHVQGHFTFTITK